MDPEFGVGLQQYIFQNYGPEVEKNIKVNIRQQVLKYMPFIDIVGASIVFGDSHNMISIQTDSAVSNKLSISIDYIIKSVGVADVINLSVDS